MGLGIDVARKGAGNGTLHRMALAGIFLATGLLGSAASINPVSPALAAPADSSGAPADSSAVPTLGGTELYGYLPYWQMTPSMVRYLSVVPVSTLELFSVGAGDDGALLVKQTGYRRVTGALGAQIIREAHARGQRVELVFTSFGFDRNHRLFGRTGLFGRVGGGERADARGDNGASETAAGAARWTRTAQELLALVRRIGVDGINVDVELIGGDAFEGYTSFLGALRAGLDATPARAQLSVATMGSNAGADLALAAIAAGVDRVFLMGYDYHWSGSNPGGSAPIDRLDGTSTLRWSIGTYLANGVPADRIVLGLPLFGMSWPVGSAERYAVRTGQGTNWIPALHAGMLTKAGFLPYQDLLEETEFTANRSVSGSGWQAIFYDSPRTLRPKLLLAREARFAGAGFWAIGYERGLPGYLELMRDFRAGKVVPLSKIDLGGR